MVYAIYRRDPVIICGQMLGVVVYFRNLVFIHRKMREESQAQPPSVIPIGDRDNTEIVNYYRPRKT